MAHAVSSVKSVPDERPHTEVATRAAASLGPPGSTELQKTAHNAHLAPLHPAPVRETASPAEASKADPDGALAARAAAGDEGAFDALVRLYTGRVFAIAFRMLGERGEAEDLSQEVFVSIYHALPNFRGESKLSTWIYRITKNRCLNRLKFLGRRRFGRHADIDDPAIGTKVVDPQTMAGQSRDPTQLLEADELSAAIQLGLKELPKDQRILVVLRDLEDLSYDEIADVTDLPLGTIKSRLHRARAALAHILTPHLAALDVCP